MCPSSIDYEEKKDAEIIFSASFGILRHTDYDLHSHFLTLAVKLKGHLLPNVAFVKLVFKACKIGNGLTVERAKNVADLNFAVSTAAGRNL